MKNLFVILFLICVIAGCGGNGEVSDAIIEPAGHAEPTAENISSIIAQHRFVALDAPTPDALIGRMIGKIKKHRSAYYISCDFKRVLRFDGEGRFIYEIDRQGRGPGEYLTFSDFDVRGETLAVLPGDKIILYNSADGSFVRNIPLDFTASSITILDDSLYCIYASDHTIALVDNSGRVVKSNGGSAHLSRLHRGNQLVEYGDRILSQIGFSNGVTVYDTKTGEFSETLLYGDGNAMTPAQEDDYIRTYGNDYEKNVTQGMMDGVASSGSQLMFATIDAGRNITMYAADSRTGRVTHTFTPNTIDDITYTSTMQWDASSGETDDGCFVTFIQPGTILTGLENNSKYADDANYKWLVENLAPHLGDDSNPVLLEYRFK